MKLISKLISKLKNRIRYYKTLVSKYSDRDTIFIYQMGKVGSTALEHSLPNAVHIHAFYSKNHICPVRMHGLAKFGVKYFIYRAEQILIGFLLRQIFKRRKQTKIITLVREPLARNQSMFFHDIDAYLYAAHTNCMNTRAKPIPTRALQPNLLFDVFNHEFDHDYALNWFDKEFYPMTGINIFNYPFSKKQGLAKISHKGITVLCLRADKLFMNTGEIQAFVNSTFELKTANRAKDKWYGDLYKKFIAEYKPSSQMTKKIVESKFYQHFFE